MKAVVLKKYGKPNVLSISEVEEPRIGPNDLLVKVHYAGVNYADLLSRQGLYSWAPKLPYILGLEASGTVEKVGESVSKFKVGDRVIVANNSGGYAEYISIHEDFALPLPETYDLKEGAAFVATFFTAWLSLTEMARVRKGEVLLVQSGAGGVGTAAIKLGRALGLTVYATTGSPHKQNLLKELGAIPLTYDNFDTEMDLQPDTILETMGGDVFKRSMKILAPMGRLISIGGTSIQVNKWNPFSLYRAWRSLPRVSFKDLLRNSKGFMGIHVGYLRRFPDRILEPWNQLKKLVEEQDIKPVIDPNGIFPLERASDAHQYIHERKNQGKVILKIQD